MLYLHTLYLPSWVCAVAVY